ncbi:MAG: hypothetical protein K2X82_08310 [Gemmataceae bacterium]|nr:hypothetical protein [Gemmataceae bacterium]
MSPREILAVAYDRGLRVEVGPFGCLSWSGPSAALTPALEKAAGLHRVTIVRLLAAGWEPKAVALDPAPDAAGAAFDHEAEALVRGLYQLDYGLLWRGDRLAVFPNEPGDRRVGLWWRRAELLWDRVQTHVGRPREHGVHLDYQLATQVMHRHDPDLDHPFAGEPVPVAKFWRYPCEPAWRALWGRFAQPDGPGGRWRFFPWGSRWGGGAGRWPRGWVSAWASRWRPCGTWDDF